MKEEEENKNKFFRVFFFVKKKIAFHCSLRGIQNDRSFPKESFCCFEDDFGALLEKMNGLNFGSWFTINSDECFSVVI